MADFEVGTHQNKQTFNCLVCATRFYDSLKGLKYLAELDNRNRPKVILQNTYGWVNGVK